MPATLRGDPGRLEQILLNLVGNAVKFTQQGEVVLAVEVAARSATEVRLRFAVRDTGIGIAAGEQARLFEAFTRATVRPAASTAVPAWGCRSRAAWSA
ncbi:hypothetical protein G4G28_10960 [Massilia sp. Dwa41.01b]|uniref:ATP-binding protein n=1 Tax=Massilia sp. Dwa41.01b TaxID=2709302 RepID=UPI00160251C4|nr:ATP-binding protein [Massilia sp. Dwa41.01b]QNA88875.1 hypothetical protein G4G28_10960 [Massilia sp. Dwa41.01b]